MFVIRDRGKTELILVLIGFVIIVLIIEFFLSKIETEGVWEWLLLSMAFFFVTPLFVITKILKRSPKEYFLALDITKKALLLTFLGIVIYVATLWLLVVQLDWKGHLTVSRWVLGSAGFLLFVDLAITPLVVFAKEFFFRGFILRSALPVLGAVGAIIFQAVLFLGYELYISGFPEWLVLWPQIVLLLFLNVMLGFIAWVNKSIVISALISWIHILAIDLFFAYQLTIPR